MKNSRWLPPADRKLMGWPMIGKIARLVPHESSRWPSTKAAPPHSTKQRKRPARQAEVARARALGQQRSRGLQQPGQEQGLQPPQHERARPGHGGSGRRTARNRPARPECAAPRRPSSPRARQAKPVVGAPPAAFGDGARASSSCWPVCGWLAGSSQTGEAVGVKIPAAPAPRAGPRAARRPVPRPAGRRRQAALP
jgi:hypothetical protein